MTERNTDRFHRIHYHVALQRGDDARQSYSSYSTGTHIQTSRLNTECLQDLCQQCIRVLVEDVARKQTFRTADFDREFARSGALRVDGERAVILIHDAVVYSRTGNPDFGWVRRTVHFHRERTSCNHRTVILTAIRL